MSQPSNSDNSSVILVDLTDRQIGVATKLDAHRNGGALHRAFSVFIADSDGRVLLQQRSPLKYHFKDLWANACCGHPQPGENVRSAAERRLAEEMGISARLEERGRFIYRSSDPRTSLTEWEVDHVFTSVFDGDPEPDDGEVQDWRWVSLERLLADVLLKPNEFCPWMPALLFHLQ